MEIVLDNEGVLYYKFINSLVFTDDFEIIYNDFIARYGEPTLLTLALLNVIVLNLGEIIDYNMNQNILYLTDYFKEEYSKKNPNEIEDVYKLCNEIISYVNSHKLNGKELSYYCANQLTLRGYSIVDRVSLTSGKNLLRTFNFIKSLQVQDFTDLVVLYADKTGELYNMRKEELCNPEYTHIACIKMLLLENPNLLQDELFVTRLKEVLDTYEKNLEGYVPEKNVSKKMLQKNYKQLRKELNKSTS